MNVALSDGRVGSHMFDRDQLLRQSIQCKEMVDIFPCLWLNHAIGLAQQCEVDRRLLQQSTKILQRFAFGDPNGRFSLVETFTLHHKDCTKQVLTREDCLTSASRG